MWLFKDITLYTQIYQAVSFLDQYSNNSFYIKLVTIFFA